MRRPVPQLQPRLRFPDAGPDAFGPGKAELLRHIAATGSIAESATQLGMSYNRAWTLVQAMNKLFRDPLVASARGGDTGGGAALTPLGTKVLALYTRMEDACRQATRSDWNALLRLLK
ncbi:MAG TPA: LysR family transcriptional regulator [Opitutaceae bacterium]|nr:LysR family transcriptional regulator [Opitutaceae bacterium]